MKRNKLKTGEIVTVEEGTPRQLYPDRFVAITNTLHMSDPPEINNPAHPLVGIVNNDFPAFLDLARPRNDNPVLVIEVATLARTSRVNDSINKDFERETKLSTGQMVDEVRITDLGIFDSSTSPKRLRWNHFDHHDGLRTMCERLDIDNSTDAKHVFEQFKLIAERRDCRREVERAARVAIHELDRERLYRSSAEFQVEKYILGYLKTLIV